MISNNYIDGLRLRMSAQTTANLNPHLFFKGYYAYGFKDHRSKYMAEMEYSFNKKEYLPREFPKNSITLTYRYDVMSPTDKFLKTDKDNVFVSFKTTTVDQMSYVRNVALKYENETQYGLKTTVEVKHSKDEPTGGLAYITNDDKKTLIPDIQTMEASLAFRYAREKLISIPSSAACRCLLMPRCSRCRIRPVLKVCLEVNIITT